MTVPWYSNCDHLPDAWCLECTIKLGEKLWSTERALEAVAAENGRLQSMLNSYAVTPAQQERLVKLVEEMAESTQVACKTLLHGYRAETSDGKVYDNKADLERELGDVDAAKKLMVAANDIDENNIAAATRQKMVNITKYLRHQPTNKE